MGDKYAAAGVNYDVLDAGKRKAVAAALSTSAYMESRGAKALDQSRGESAFVFQLGGRYLAQVLECLGTKSTIARQYQDETGVNRFAEIGYDSVAAIINDIVCVGALPLVVNAYFATGSPDWYSTGGRFEALVDGWREACQDSGAAWGGGESPGLSGIIAPTEIDLAGSAVGEIPDGREPILGDDLAAGNAIVLLASSGLHANGASLVRKIVTELPNAYSTPMDAGTTFGEGVLTRSVIYADVVEKLMHSNLNITYMSHITGHGFRKVMRANKELTYRINTVPPVPEVLSFIARNAGLNDQEAYGTFNMGAGFAIYCDSQHAQQVVDIAKSLNHDAWICGVVESGPRRVIVEPIDAEYTDEDLQLR